MSKVVLDGDVLGLGFFYKQARTGIYRVAENLLNGLNQSHDIELAMAGTQYLPEIIAYLQGFHSDIPVLNASGDLKYARLENSIVSTFPYRSVPQKAVKRGLQYVKDYIRPLAQLDMAALSHYDIYHSPFHPIRKELNELPKLRKVLTVHDLIPLLFPSLFNKWNIDNMKQILDSIDHHTHPICVSEATKIDLCEATGISPDRVFVVHLAASDDKFYQVRDNEEKERVLLKYNIDIRKPYLLSLATLEPRKNIERTVRSFLKLIQQQKIDDLNLVLAGSKGWDFATIFEEIKANPILKERIIVTDYIVDKDLAALYSSALAFVYPSLYEGFGLPPLEAMQCGTPVISSNNSSIPEVVEDAGLLVEPTDEEAIADAMLKLYSDRTLGDTLSKKALMQAQKFSWKKFTEQHIQIYRQIS